MTENHASLLAEYRDGDLNRRLHMYLQLPELRSDFIEIDRNLPNMDWSKTAGGKNTCGWSLGRALSGMFSRVLTNAVDWILPEGLSAKRARS